MNCFSQLTKGLGWANLDISCNSGTFFQIGLGCKSMSIILIEFYCLEFIGSQIRSLKSMVVLHYIDFGRSCPNMQGRTIPGCPLESSKLKWPDDNKKAGWRKVNLQRHLFTGTSDSNIGKNQLWRGC